MTNSFLAYHTEPMWPSLIFGSHSKRKRRNHTGVSTHPYSSHPVIDSCESCHNRLTQKFGFREISLIPTVSVRVRPLITKRDLRFRDVDWCSELLLMKRRVARLCVGCSSRIGSVTHYLFVWYCFGIICHLAVPPLMSHMPLVDVYASSTMKLLAQGGLASDRLNLCVTISMITECALMLSYTKQTPVEERREKIWFPLSCLLNPFNHSSPKVSHTQVGSMVRVYILAKIPLRQ